MDDTRQCPPAWSLTPSIVSHREWMWAQTLVAPQARYTPSHPRRCGPETRRVAPAEPDSTSGRASTDAKVIPWTLVPLLWSVVP